MSAGPSWRCRAAAGQGLLSALVALALLGLVLGLGTVAVHRQVARQAPLAAARRFASELRLRRSEAIALGRRRGLLFEREDERWLVSLWADGDGDGLLAEDRRNGRDALLSGPESFVRRYGALGPGFLPGLASLRSPPPSGRPLGSLDDPVRFGRGDVVSFSPRGSTTGGTLYLSDGGARQLAVVVVGATSRVRIWEWLPAEDRWLRR